MFFNLGSAELPSFWKIYDKRIRWHPKQTNFIVGPWKKRMSLMLKHQDGALEDLGSSCPLVGYLSGFGHVTPGFHKEPISWGCICSSCSPLPAFKILFDLYDFQFHSSCFWDVEVRRSGSQLLIQSCVEVVFVLGFLWVYYTKELCRVTSGLTITYIIYSYVRSRLYRSGIFFFL